MEPSRIELLKKYSDKHFLNKFKYLENYEDVPRSLRFSLLGHDPVEGKKMFNRYKSDGGHFYYIDGPSDRYLAFMSPKKFLIFNDQDVEKDADELEMELNLRFFSLTLRDLLNYIADKQSSKITESDIRRLIKKILD